ncbi:MAG: hypothetical protein Q8877_02430 [Sweet potato little leaf phytoplasma]|nr:hypothetical protein [Sweet potato little leaf phytoplasma]
MINQSEIKIKFFHPFLFDYITRRFKDKSKYSLIHIEKFFDMIIAYNIIN